MNDYTSAMRKAAFWAFGAAIIIKLFLFDMMLAAGDSMTPTIKNGTVLVINRLQYGLRFPWQRGYIVRWSSPKPGEIVVFYTPEGEIAVKRCVMCLENGTFMARGDNSLQSYDSRSYGNIPADNTIGRALGYR